MTLIACKECGREISASAPACPSCGSTKHKTKLWPWLLGVPIVVLILMLIYGSSIPEYKTHAREVREVCEKMFPLQRDVCRTNYDRAIADGLRQASPPAPSVPTYVPTAADLKKRADEDAALQSTQTADCKTNLGAKVVEYKKLMAERRYWPAALSLQVCANVLGEKSIKTMVAEAELKHLKGQIEDTKTSPFDRIRFINTLMRDYPSQGAKYKSLLDKLEREGPR